MQTGLILAGGDSSRFGTPKAFARFRGRPMVQWVADALAARSDELLVSARSPDHAERIRAILPEARVVLDVRPGRGPIEGFARGFEAARGDTVLVAPCDAPLLQAALYDLLLEALGYHEAAVPRLRAIDPLRAVYRKDAVRRGLAERAPESPSSLVDSLWPIILDADELRKADPSLCSFVDANCREDLRRAARDPGLGDPRDRGDVRSPGRFPGDPVRPAGVPRDG